MQCKRSTKLILNLLRWQDLERIKKKRVCNSCFYHSSLLLRESTRIEKRELSFPADSPVLEGPVLNLVQSRLGECVTLVWIMCMVDQWWINSTSAPPRSPKIKREISLSPSVSLKVIWVQQTSALHQWTSTLVFVVYARIYHYLQWKVGHGAHVLQEHHFKIAETTDISLSLPFYLFFKLSLSIEIMLSFRKLIYSIHWFYLQEKAHFRGFLNGGTVAVKHSIWSVFSCAAISLGGPQVGV